MSHIFFPYFHYSCKFQLPLQHSFTVEIEKSEMNEVLAVSKASRENVSPTVNRLLEAIYSKACLGSQSLSGAIYFLFHDR